MRARPSLSLLGAAVLATTAVVGAAPAHAAPAAPTYVALGDSYSSLPADATVGASQQERACGRSTHTYPKLVAASLGLAPDALRDNTCGGAKTRDAFASQHAGSAKTGYYDAAPQLDGITIGYLITGAFLLLYPAIAPKEDLDHRIIVPDEPDFLDTDAPSGRA